MRRRTVKTVLPIKSSVSLAILLIVNGYAIAQSVEPGVSWAPAASGKESLEGAYGSAENELQKLRLEIQLQLDGAFTKNTNYRVIGRLRIDPAFDNGETVGGDFPELSEATRPLRIGDSAELELREAYVRTTQGDWHLTLGKQQIVWGVADGLKVIDVVNPRDLREFVLTDFESSRVPLWAAKAERALGDWNLQIVLVPDKSYYILPRQDSEFEISSGIPSVPPGFHLEIEAPSRPSNFLLDSDAGFQFSTFKKGWDITFNYLYHYDDLPAFPRTFGITGDGPAVLVEPEYKRSHLLGGTASKAIGDVTLRAEYGLFLDKYYSTSSLRDTDGVVKGNSLSYMVGLDWFGIKNTVVSVQVFQDMFTNNAKGLERDKVQTYTTFTVQYRLLHDTLLLETVWFQDLNHGDGLLRPKVTYEVNDRLSVYAGADYFFGSNKGFFGQFDTKDRIYSGVSWSF